VPDYDFLHQIGEDTFTMETRIDQLNNQFKNLYNIQLKWTPGATKQTVNRIKWKTRSARRLYVRAVAEGLYVMPQLSEAEREML
jgi:hypothetical protein